MTTRHIFPVIDPRELKTLTARLRSEGLKVPVEPETPEAPDADGRPIPGTGRPAVTRTVRLPRRACRLYAQGTLAEAPTKFGRFEVKRLTDEPRLSRYSFDRVYSRALRARRRSKTRPSGDARLAALVESIQIGCDAFEAARKARARARRRAAVA